MKFSVCPIYSNLSKIAATVFCAHLNGFVGNNFPLFCKLYAVGVSTFSFCNRFAICVGPRPPAHSSKIYRTVFAASSSISHLCCLLLTGYYSPHPFRVWIGFWCQNPMLAIPVDRYNAFSLPFSPNVVPAPVFSAAFSRSFLQVKSWRSIPFRRSFNF